MIYAGIGARETPGPILDSMRNAATALAKAGVGLRTGGAKGADQAFFDGWERVGQEQLLEVFVPYSGFRGFRVGEGPVYGPPTREARLLAKEYHPNWAVLGDTGRDFHARNCYQILGFDLKTPCDFVLCWTKDGKVVGGTGQALRLATAHEIPIFNLGSMSQDEVNEAIMEMLNA
ncbi:DprA-like DNA recombination-mediator protein [Roseobacter phage RD-1410W1-01]|uniref:DNA recombination-mediator protein A n=1 Tax=Roseobacter phage RD-1410W1-01 TaxID=1815984 RepID=A0A191VYJ8_9CAUD|nr:DprA-like DNA recombination-mediator protein [Roseobacter phage RD-1410W1-01]ANJ20785.1 hypothetical protein RDp01_gp51 [Roseobacter phage RD-1410W1-01]